MALHLDSFNHMAQILRDRAPAFTYSTDQTGSFAEYERYRTYYPKKRKIPVAKAIFKLEEVFDPNGARQSAKISFSQDVGQRKFELWEVQGNSAQVLEKDQGEDADAIRGFVSYLLGANPQI